MDKELALLLPLIGDRAEACIGGTVYHTGRIGHHDVIVGKCGIGKVNAALGTAALVDMFHPALVVNTGVAGSTGVGDPPLEMSDLLLPDTIAYHDVWCGPGTTWGDAYGFEGGFTCPLPAHVRESIGARGGMLASGDVFVDGARMMSRVLEVQPTAVAVDMESAAMAQTCATRGVPFVCLRVISDSPSGVGNTANYEQFWQHAPECTFRAVEQLMTLL